jgi:cytoskeletal protein RodZ
MEKRTVDDDFNFDTMVPEEPSRNRTFWVYLGALLGIVILSVIAILLWINVFSPRQQQAQNAEATQTAAALTEIALAQVPTSTNTPWPSNTPEPTETPAPTQTTVPVAQATTSVPTIESTFTPTPTPTALPDTGFADDISLPGLALLGVILVVVVILARRIRVGMTN